MPLRLVRFYSHRFWQTLVYPLHCIYVVALLFIGFILSIIMAPETKNMSLSETSSINNKSKSLKQQDSFVSSKA